MRKLKMQSEALAPVATSTARRSTSRKPAERPHGVMTGPDAHPSQGAGYIVAQRGAQRVAWRLRSVGIGEQSWPCLAGKCWLCLVRACSCACHGR
jgi:hypothetical protein